MTTTEARLLIAATCAIMAAWLLVRWQHNVTRDHKWLDQRFGESSDNESIARAACLLWSIVLAGLSVLALYA